MIYAIELNETITIHEKLPKVCNGILGFRNSSIEVQQENGFFEYVPAIITDAQVRGKLYFDAVKKIFTREVINIAILDIYNSKLKDFDNTIIDYRNKLMKVSYENVIKGNVPQSFIDLVNALEVEKLKDLFFSAWDDFKAGKFSYDGATFVKERSEFTIFEVAGFIHDWRNCNGYVGLKIDNEMFSIMSYLCYAPHHFKVRARWTFLTWLNWLRHKYYLKDLQAELPTNLLIIKE